MGLASALSTALTGMTAAETTIDVVGNNLANANTVGFKASSANFATQFLQTQSLGSAPTDTSGGTNPRQTGLGTMVADITPNFNQGSFEVSASPMDMALEGDGFFIVRGAGGEHFYTRNGIFRMNAQNELVTISGNRLLGYGVDDQFQIQRTALTSLEIPLGATAVAQATQNVYLEGTLTPTGDLADTAEIIQTGVLGDDLYSAPASSPDYDLAPRPELDSWPPGVTGTPLSGGGPPLGPAGDFQYRFVFSDDTQGTPGSTESIWSTDFTVTVDGINDEVQLDNLPLDLDQDYSYVRIYRTESGGSDFYYVGERALPGVPGPISLSDTTTDAALVLNDPLDLDTISGDYSYFVTFATPGGAESRPSPVSSSTLVTDGRILLTDLPTVAPGDTSGWTVRRIYRNTLSDPQTYHLIREIPNTTGDVVFTDNLDDATISDPANPTLDFDGPKITGSTLLTNLLRRDGNDYYSVFEDLGTLEFGGRKGGRSLATKELEITATTTVLDLIGFMEEALGIQTDSGDALHPMPDDISGAAPGGSVTTDGRICLVGNNGVDNAIEIRATGMRLTTDDISDPVYMPFSSTQTAVGESAVTDFLAYDSLGIPLQVRLTAVLESRDGSSTTYRWFADSPDNDPNSGVDISVGTGLIRFDEEGNFDSATETNVSIERQHIPSASPLEFELDFSQASGLAAESSNLAVSRQDGSGPGVLTSFIVGEDGLIRGVFSNGITRDLGQIRLARFGNPAGLAQKGENLFATGVNSGLPVEGNPGEQGIGSIVSGALELSNADIGGNLIDLILASTMYRGNTRVITTTQQILDELLSLRR